MNADEEQRLKLLILKAKEKGFDLTQEVKIDPSKTYEENKEIILRAIGEKKKEREKTKPQKPQKPDVSAELERMKKQEDEVRKRMMEEFNRSIEEIKRNSNPELDRYFRVPKELIKIAVRQKDVNGIVIRGSAGLGKTYITIQALGEIGLKAEDFVYVSSYITPVELYNLIFKNREKIIVLDDVEALMDNPKALAILKSALWSVGEKGKRWVSYVSPTHLLKAPQDFEFEGKVIVLLNRIPKAYREDVESLMSRVLTYRLNFDYATRLKIMYEISKLFGIPFEVVDYLNERYTPAFENFSFRTLIQTNLIYEYYKQNPPHNGVGWKQVVDELVAQGSNPTLLKVWELMNSDKSVNEQVDEFVNDTGYSRRTFFRLKKQLDEEFGVVKKVPRNLDIVGVIAQRGEATAEEIKQAVVGGEKQIAVSAKAT